MTAPAATELRLLIEEYDPQNSDWNFRKGVMLDILDRQAASVGAEVAGEADILTALQKFRGEMLHEASKTDSCYTCYTDLAAYVARRLRALASPSRSEKE